MSRSTACTAIFSILALAGAIAAVAQTTPMHPAPKTAEKTFVGVVASIDTSANKVTVREQAAATRPDPATNPPADTGKTMTFSVDAQTKITGDMPDAKPASGAAQRPSTQEKKLDLKDLHAGDRVSVKYDEAGGQNLAKSIDVLSKFSS